MSSALGLMAMKNKSIQILNDMFDKYRYADAKYDNHPSLQHSAWIIQEEFEEFGDELKVQDDLWSKQRIYEELIDIMTACYRTIIDNKLLEEQTNEHIV